MTLKFEASALKAAVTRVAGFVVNGRGLPLRRKIEIRINTVHADNRNAMMEVTANNHSMAKTVKIPITVEVLPGKSSVHIDHLQLKRFLASVNAKPGEIGKAAIITSDDKARLEIAIGNAAITLDGDTEDNPIFPNMSSKRGNIVEFPIGFFESVRRVAPFASTNTDRYYLCGVCIEADEERQICDITATDGAKLANIKVPIIGLDKMFKAQPSIIIPSALVDEIVAEVGHGRPWFANHYYDDLVGRLHLIGADWEIIGRMIDGKYPDWRRIVQGIGMTNKISFSVRRDELLAATKAIKNVLGNMQMKFSYADNRLQVGSKSAVAGAGLHFNFSAASGADFKFHIFPSTLDEVLKFGESTIVSFRSKGEMEPFVVEFEGANETVIVMPARGD